VTTRLDIYSDVVCPWCYLGAANLMRAIGEMAGRHPFAIRWHAFQLDPTIPPGGHDRDAYFRARSGDRDLADADARLERMGAEVGIAFHFDRIARAPNSLDAHRVIHWAAAEGLQTRTAMALFARHFEEGEDISDPEVLRSAAEEAGLDGAAVARLLAGDADVAAVAAEGREAIRMGITGVPTYVIAGAYAVSGAQPPEVWMRLAGELAASVTES
jgi:predicted DsbA family dithiol-disulfide isomerase